MNEKQKPVFHTIFLTIAVSVLVLGMYLVMQVYLGYSDLEKADFKNLSIREVQTNIDPKIITNLRNTVE